MIHAALIVSLHYLNAPDVRPSRQRGSRSHLVSSLEPGEGGALFAKKDCGCDAGEWQRFDRPQWLGTELLELLSQRVVAPQQKTTPDPAPGHTPSCKGLPWRRVVAISQCTVQGRRGGVDTGAEALRRRRLVSKLGDAVSWPRPLGA